MEFRVKIGQAVLDQPDKAKGNDLQLLGNSGRPSEIRRLIVREQVASAAISNYFESRRRIFAAIL